MAGYMICIFRKPVFGKKIYELQALPSYFFYLSVATSTLIGTF